MAQGQTKGKYWLANNPNSEVTNAEVKELGTISEADLGVVSDLTVTANELNKTTAVNTSVTALAAAGALAANTTYHVTDTDAAAYTLPAPAAGLEFWFHAGATQVTGGNHTIVTNSSANVIEGSLSSPEQAAVSCVAAADTISFIADLAVQGDLAHVWSDGTDWYLDGHCFVQDGMTTTQAS